jgi:hypothetical protein
VFLIALALTETPISTSSAAACTTVEAISVPEGGAGRLEAGFGGAPAGCFGCRSGSPRPFARDTDLFGAVVVRLSAELPVEPRLEGFAAARLSLRRWGRVRGNPPRISGGFSSLMART